MTYNVFSGTLNPTQSIKPCHTDSVVTACIFLHCTVTVFYYVTVLASAVNAMNRRLSIRPSIAFRYYIKIAEHTVKQTTISSTDFYRPDVLPVTQLTVLKH